jgi:hypothetical protein
MGDTLLLEVMDGALRPLNRAIREHAPGGTRLASRQKMPSRLCASAPSCLRPSQAP